jgi:(1->4)-alpha-D-glucan 1-alpha-D-glucosylmutase
LSPAYSHRYASGCTQARRVASQAHAAAAVDTEEEQPRGGTFRSLKYRDYRLLALNEVGCEPGRPAPDLGRFHLFMQERAEREPHAMSATATHDTKRGEDARARLLTLTEAPDRWAATVARWRAKHRPLVRKVSGRPAPEPEVEWMIYQALLGTWPDGLRPQDAESLGALRVRFLAFLEKALREAKLRTAWTDIYKPYEAAVCAYAERLFDPENPFLTDFIHETAPFRATGRLNGLAQTLVKMTAPGIPDIYQGTEGGDFSMVDPDNRRFVDFDRLTARLLEVESPRALPEWKARIIKEGLSARRLCPDLFRFGDYIPLEVHGPACTHLAAYVRLYRKDAAIVVAPRLVFGLVQGDAMSTGRWLETFVGLPGHLASRRYREMLTGRTFETSAALPAAELLARSPCALLMVE